MPEIEPITRRAQFANSAEKKTDAAAKAASTEASQPVTRISHATKTASATHWFLRPYTQLWLSILFSAAAQLLLKKGADQTVSSIWLGIAGLRSGWVWLGILALVTSLVSWLHALRSVPLIVAYNLAGAIHILVPLSCAIFLGEKIGLTRGCGIALVLLGVLIVARPVAKVEERLEDRL